jgi:hypothetical protein
MTREQGTGNRVQGTGYRVQGTGNRFWATLLFVTYVGFFPFTYLTKKLAIQQLPILSGTDINNIVENCREL